MVTPSAENYVAKLRELRRHAHNMAHEDEASTFSRLSWESKRDTYDFILRELEGTFEAVEREAVFGVEEDSPATAELVGLPW